MKKSMLILYVCFLLNPLIVFGYETPIVTPDDQVSLIPVNDPIIPQEFFGRLQNFPHTYVFEVTEPFTFKASLFVDDAEAQKNDLSIIVVKEERRGVTEVGRTNIKNESWESVKDRSLVHTFRNGGFIESELSEGSYKLEVSAPNNDGIYRLVLGTEDVDRGYISAVRTLFEVTSFFNKSFWHVFLSPLIYVPFILLLALSTVLYIYMYRTRKTT